MAQTLLDILMKRYPTAKRQTLKRMVSGGRVLIDGAMAKKLSEPIKADAKVIVRDAAEAAPPPTPLRRFPLDIVFEDDDLLVVNKPAGLLTSTTPREPRGTLLKIVREHVERQGNRQARAGLIHRLDRDASGLLVFSKNDVAYRSLKTQFFKHTVDRVYVAIVDGVPEPDRGKLESRLVERADGSVRSTIVHAKGQRAITEYETIASDGTVSMLRVRLLTGRKHQIRTHLSDKSVPILGDLVYGSTTDRSRPRPSRLLLHACELGLEHPRTGKPMRFKSEAPPEFKAALRLPST